MGIYLGKTTSRYLDWCLKWLDLDLKFFEPFIVSYYDSDDDLEQNQKHELHDQMEDFANEDHRYKGCRVGSRIIPVNTCWTDRKSCTYYECREGSLLNSVECGEDNFSHAIAKCVEVPGDSDKDFPHCCPKVVCKKPKIKTIEDIVLLPKECEKDQKSCLYSD